MLAGYITATTTDFARVVLHQNKIKLLQHESFANSEFSDFDSVLSLYLRKTKTRVSCACFGVAGPVISDKVTTTNLPWQLAAKDIKSTYDFGKVILVNDLVATAQGLFQLDDDKFITINKGRRIKNGNIGLIAPGTGLGVALLFNDGNQFHPYASEGGHRSFSPTSQLECDLWQYLYSSQGYVEEEDVISRAGIERLYEFLLVFERATRPDWMKKARDKPSRIIEKALSGEDDVAVKTLDLFADCLASAAADLAMTGMTLGGIYLGGLIAPQIMTQLTGGRFVDRFIKQGKMPTLLQRIPVQLIIDDRTALLGAGAIAMENK